VHTLTQSRAVAPRGLAWIVTRRNVPFAVIVFWWAVCFGLYAAGWPIPYTHHNILGVSALMAGTAICAAVGYRLGIGSQVPEPRTVGWTLPVPVLIGFAATLILVIPQTQAYSGFSLLDLGKALTNQGAAYSGASERIAEGFGARSAIVVVQALLAPFTLIVLPYFALSWFERRRHGVLLLVALVPPIVLGLLGARSVDIGISGIVLVGSWILSRVRRRMPLRGFEVVILVFVAIAGIMAFGAQKLSRIGIAPICPPGGPCTRNDPGFIEGTWVLFASYASQGLEGLGHALDAHWVFGGGFSHSKPVESMLAAFFHFQPAPVVTSQLTTFGWSDTRYWSTALTSIANDVPWPLVPFVIGAYAVILGAVWRSAVERGDWLSVAVFCYAWLGLLFVPQNLQLAISGPTYVGFIVLLGWYFARSVLTRYRVDRWASINRFQTLRRTGSRKNE